MTKKDYKAIADILSGHKNHPSSLENKTIEKEIEILTAELCYYFKKDNPRFDEARFKKVVFGK